MSLKGLTVHKRCLARRLAPKKCPGSVSGPVSAAAVYRCAHLRDRQTEVPRRQWLQVQVRGRWPCCLWPSASWPEDRGHCTARRWPSGRWLRGACPQLSVCISRPWRPGACEASYGAERGLAGRGRPRTCQNSAFTHQRAWSSSREPRGRHPGGCGCVMRPAASLRAQTCFVGGDIWSHALRSLCLADAVSQAGSRRAGSGWGGSGQRGAPRRSGGPQLAGVRVPLRTSRLLRGSAARQPLGGGGIALPWHERWALLGCRASPLPTDATRACVFPVTSSQLPCHLRLCEHKQPVRTPRRWSGFRSWAGEGGGWRGGKPSWARRQGPESGLRV